MADSAAAKVGFLGAGGIAACVAERAAVLERVDLIGFSAPEGERAQSFAREYNIPRLSQEQLIESTEIIVEAANPAALLGFAPAAMKRGRTMIVMSINGLIACPSLLDQAAKSGGRLILATGALAGLDAILAARVTGIESVRLKSTKPPSAFPKSFPDGPPVAAHCLFSGSAREAGRLYPKNTNVAASLALAAYDPLTGPDRVTVEIWADPALTTNIHEIEVRSGAGTIRSTVANRPLRRNPATSQLAANSAIAALQKLTSTCTFA